MKKIAIVLLAVFVLFSLASCASDGGNGGGSPAATERLVIYNWAEYIDEGDDESGRPGLIAAFEQYYFEQTGVRISVEYNTFETNEEMVTKAMVSDTEMDLICPSEYTIQKLLINGMLREINFDNIENSANINTDILDTISEVFGEIEGNDGTKYDMTKYMVPYMWGTLGILYNTEVVTEEDLAHGYGLLWNEGNNPKLNGKILMKDSVRDSYVAVVLYAKEQGLLPEKYDALSIQDLINSVNKELLAVAESLLLKQSGLLYGYEVDFGKDDMVKGNAYVDLAWSGDAIYAIESGLEEDVYLDYFVPEIGGNIWFDGWVIPKKVKNLRAAEMFINFMCDPVNAIYNMTYIGYTSAVDKEVLMENEEVLEILEYYEYDPEEYFSDPIRYPEITENMGVMKDFGKEADAVIMMWESIKPYKTTELGIILGVIIGAVALAAGIYFAVNRLKMRPRRVK